MAGKLVNKNKHLSRIEQVVEFIRKGIEKEQFKFNDQLPTINKFSADYSVARDTVEKAYGLLKRSGYIQSVPGKGYFVAARKKDQLRILLVLNKLSAYKKIVYNSFVKALGEKAWVDLQVHHYNFGLLKEIIESKIGQYHYYAIMPHFDGKLKQSDLIKILKSIPEDELVMLDKRVKGLKSDCIEVFQDFENDIYKALVSAKEILAKYTGLSIILRADSLHPKEIIDGAKKFCEQTGRKFDVLSGLEEETLTPGKVYIDTSESDLAVLLKKAKEQGLQPGRDIGVISFNETALKDLLNITVITTDFAAMGTKAAECILNNKKEKVANPFYMIRRSSV
ncbi:GntR family transcriptional regulator [Niabella soli]|uniref:GntR family transcriptional regulator n=1 Tax=Niabella soli DSM 19437 TaxID=929713 RepID=W0F572_9BACT|nr:GntR family transcriptional regulator [Niabella soli]AHF16953.1 GntR family transcriptional regulator [Niabella soli DSM 19437]